MICIVMLFLLILQLMKNLNSKKYRRITACNDHACNNHPGTGILSFAAFVLIYLTGCSSETKSSFIQGKGVSAEHAMVVSAHPLSSRIGAEILKKGGNAIDAAIATEFALAVCYPEAGNIGGGGFMLIRTTDGKTSVIDYREKAPGRASRNMYVDSTGKITEGLSTETHLASGVPGTVDGMIQAHSLYGKLPFKELIQPSVDLAEKGFPVTARQAEDLNSNRDTFIKRNTVRTAFVKDIPWKEGDLLIQKDLAATLERIRDNERDGFYSGKTATFIIREMQKGNGIINHEDLSDYKSKVRNAISAEYRGYKVITVPPPSSGGIILLQLLGMTEPYPSGQWGFNSYGTIHLIAEAERRAFADRSEYIGDPDFVTVPVKGLTDKKYLQERMSSFNENAASPSTEIHPGEPGKYESMETTHYAVVDEMGNAVSATTTLNGTFGSSIVADSAGFLLNNEMDDFSAKPGSPNMYGLVGGEANAVAPGKKMLSSMTPSILEKGGKLFMVVGSPGGSTIPTTVYQVITNVIDQGMNMQEAADAPRFHHQWLPDMIIYEKGRIDSSAAVYLRNAGHKLEERTSIGRVSAIMITGEGKKTAGADRRGDNSACGY